MERHSMERIRASEVRKSFCVDSLLGSSFGQPTDGLVEDWKEISTFAMRLDYGEAVGAEADLVAIVPVSQRARFDQTSQRYLVLVESDCAGRYSVSSPARAQHPHAQKTDPWSPLETFRPWRLVEFSS
jgi:hypothetical protein